MTEKLRFIPLILVVAALGVVAWSLLNYEENLLWKLQENTDLEFNFMRVKKNRKN